MTDGSRTFLQLAAAICMAAILPACATRQSGLELHKPQIRADLQYRREDERRTSAQFSDRMEDTDTHRQKLDIVGTGSYYDPDFVSFRYGISPQWQQQTVDVQSTFQREDDNVFLGYLLDARILRQKPQSVNVFLRRSRNRFDSTLSPDNINEIEVSRLVWGIDLGRLETDITLEKNATDFQDFFRSLDASDVFRLESRHDTGTSRTMLRAELIEQDRQIGVAKFTTDRRTLSANNSYRFGSRYHLFSSLLSVDSESEIFDATTTFLSERLDIDHSTNLRTQYEVRYDARESNGFESDTVLASASLRHRLYENLTTTLALQRIRESLTDGSVVVDEADLDLRYVRAIPVGQLLITGGYGYRVEDSGITASVSQVLDERIVLSGFEGVALIRNNIDPATVVVTDESSSTIYVEGIDYFVSVIGDSTIIERSLLGGIADGESVLVDYSFIPRAPFETARNSSRFGVSLRLWRALRLYFNQSRTVEELRSGALPNDLANDRIRRLGAELRWRWSTTLAELEKRDTVRVPLDRFRAQQSFAFQVRQGVSLAFSAGYTDIEFRDENAGSDSTAVDLSVNLRASFRRMGNFEVRAYSREIDSDAQRIETDGLTGLWRWRYGAWSTALRYDSIAQVDELNPQSWDRDVIFVSISRLIL